MLCDEVELSSVAGAEMAERILRQSGFPNARILDERSVDEALGHVAHWRVVRDAMDAWTSLAAALHARGT